MPAKHKSTLKAIASGQTNNHTTQATRTYTIMI